MQSRQIILHFNRSCLQKLLFFVSILIVLGKDLTFGYVESLLDTVETSDSSLDLGPANLADSGLRTVLEGEVNIGILNLGVCILLHVLDRVQGLPSNATLFQHFITILFKSEINMLISDVYISA
jgi:hypothetical protein